MDLLAAEIMAKTGKDPGEIYKSLTERFGNPIYERIDAPANGEPIGGIKVVARNGWFAARPSGTEDIYKIYTESFKSREHLLQIQREAGEIVSKAFKAAGV